MPTSQMLPWKDPEKKKGSDVSVTKGYWEKGSDVIVTICLVPKQMVDKVDTLTRSCCLFWGLQNRRTQGCVQRPYECNSLKGNHLYSRSRCYCKHLWSLDLVRCFLFRERQDEVTNLSLCDRVCNSPVIAGKRLEFDYLFFLKMALKSSFKIVISQSTHGLLQTSQNKNTHRNIFFDWIDHKGLTSKISVTWGKLN